MKKYPPPGIQIGVSLYNQTEISSLTRVTPTLSDFSFEANQDLLENDFDDESKSKISKHPTSDMHIYCTGPKRNGSPLIVYEAAEGLTGFMYYGQQQSLAQISFNISSTNFTSSDTDGKIGIRSCSYDRAGFGWSDNVPIGNHDVYIDASKLHELLQKSGELDHDQLIILVGHGEGGLFAQTYTYFYPDHVAGLVLIDTYPDYDALYNFTPYRKAESSKRESACRNLNLLRAGGPLGISSLLISSTRYQIDNDSQTKIYTFDNYKPSSELGTPRFYMPSVGAPSHPLLHLY